MDKDTESQNSATEINLLLGSMKGFKSQSFSDNINLVEQELRTPFSE